VSTKCLVTDSVVGSHQSILFLSIMPFFSHLYGNFIQESCNLVPLWVVPFICNEDMNLAPDLNPTTASVLAEPVEVVLRHFHRCRHWSSTAVVLLLEGLRSHKVLVIGEYGGHEGLRGSGRRSVTLYVHG
jgi:hypothetical protein